MHNKLKLQIIIFIFFMNFSFGFALGAEDESSKNVKNNIVDFAIPESPAFTVLGLTPQNVVAPSSPRQLATSLLNGVDKNGNFQTGIAIDTSILNLRSGSVTVDDYRRIAWLYRTQLSFATTKGSDVKDESLRMAFGLRLNPLDMGDPRRKSSPLTLCYAQVSSSLYDKKHNYMDIYAKNRNDNANTNLSDTEVVTLSRVEYNVKDDAFKKNFEANADSEAKQCQKKAADSGWNTSRWTLGVAPSWISQTGKTDDMKFNGGGFWTSLSIGPDLIYRWDESKTWDEWKKRKTGLLDDFQLILHARYMIDENVPNPDITGAFLEQNSFIMGGRLRWGISSSFFLSLESSYVNADRKSMNTDDYLVYALGLDYKLTSGIWLEVSGGTNSGRDKGQDEGFVIANLKWALTKTPKFKALKQ